MLSMEKVELLLLPKDQEELLDPQGSACDSRQGAIHQE